MNWLEKGDWNTKFFHTCANFQRKSNFVASISNTIGRCWDKTEEVQFAFIDYFHNLFTSKIVGDVQTCVENLSCRVTEDMNRVLLKPFCMEEITLALKIMGPLKAPGPDGFTVGFFSEELGYCRRGYRSSYIGYP